MASGYPVFYVYLQIAASLEIKAELIMINPLEHDYIR